MRFTKISLIFSTIVFFIVFCNLYELRSQNLQVKFDKLSLSEGLSQSTVNSIIQDKKGFMWFATLDGLNKYDGFNFIVYKHDPNSENSLPENAINVLFQSSDGSIWIGTRTMGLCLYNPIFNTFTRIPLLGKGKSENHTITSICQDYKNNLWIGSSTGIFKINLNQTLQSGIDIKHKNITHFLSNIRVNSVTVFDDYVWIATETGLTIYNIEKSQFATLIKRNIPLILKKIYISKIHFDSDGTLWLGTNSGLFRYDPVSNDLKQFMNDKNNPFSISGNNITCIAEEDEGNLWIGTSENGLNYLEKNGSDFQHISHDPLDLTSLSINDIRSLYIDKTKILWIGTSLGGINKKNAYGGDFKLFRHSPFKENTLSSNQVRSIYQDSKGKYWIGTVDGGLNMWDREANEFTHYYFDAEHEKSLSHNYVRSIFEDSDSTLWIGTDGGGLNKFIREDEEFIHYTSSSGKKGPGSNRIWKIIEGANKTLWLATYGGGVTNFDLKNETFTVYQNNPKDINSLSNNEVTTVYLDQRKDLWIGTYGGGLNKFTLIDSTFEVFQANSGSNSIGSNYIYCITEDNNNDLWIGAKGSLNKYFREKKQFKVFTEKDGLPNDVILGILEDNNEYLWLSTNKGLVKFDLVRERNVRNFDVNDGLQSNEFLVGSYFKSKSGELFFGGINGFNAFYPEDITENPYPPEVAITSFKVLNQEVNFDTVIPEKNHILLTYQDYSFTFEFVSLDYAFPEKNQFSYILEGFDKDWIDGGTKRFASYTNLPPDKTYKFKVKGSNNDNVWSPQIKTVTVYIEPAFWQTLWFKLSVIVFILLIVSYFVYSRIKRIHRQKIELERLVKERTAEILQQKEEIEAQRDQIEAQRDEVRKQRDLANAQKNKIEIQNNEIMSSIMYAQRIQNASLPELHELSLLFKDYFLIFHPRDIVSGDFYWMSKRENIIVLVAADCTGHGVPGAFMSMFGISFLNRIVNEENFVYPSDILNNLRSCVISSLKQTGEINEARDGMDISLCTIDLNSGILQFAGANNPMYVIRDMRLTEIKGDKMPIGIYDRMDSFTTREFTLQKGDCIYLFSDGYPDQFGGKKNKKFKYKNFKQLLLESSEVSLKEQKEILEEILSTWKGDNEQVDDILVMGFKY